MPKRLPAFAVFAFASVFVVACSATVDEEEPTGETDEAITGTISLKYEGTCEFLRSCSSYSRGLAEGVVNWGCTGVGACDDDERWVAAPSRSYCGRTVKFCKRDGTCTTAKVKDVSVSRSWEASNGVLDALDLPHGLHGRCSGYGGGRVTVSTP